MTPEHASAPPAQTDDRDYPLEGHRINDQHARRVRECFQKQHGPLVRWLQVRSGSEAVARDIANEAFMAVLEVKQPIGDLTPYLYKVAGNLLARRCATEATHRRLDTRIACGPDLSSPSPEPLVAQEQQALALMRTLEALPPRIRETVRLRFWEELSYAEIVQRLREKGVVVHLRTVIRWVAEGVEQCREAMEAQERPK
jgi:RNA polymerase sigma factor (sigma-70 family)